MAKSLMDFLRGPKSMHPAKGANTTTAFYWLNWRASLCYIWIIALVAMSWYFITKYESRRTRDGEEEDSNGGVLYEDESWKPSLKRIHPAWLMSYRIFSFLALLLVIILNYIANKGGIFYYYTDWTFILLIIYFGFGSFLSMYGCYHYQIGPGDRSHPRQAAGLFDCGRCSCSYGLYFLVHHRTPVLARKDVDDFHFLPIAMHLVNLVFLLGDVALNRLRFPWFRIAYFIIWTCIFVIFQWILHACIALWWPYSFLDLSSKLSPLWYILVALLHIPCYGVFFLIIKLKHFLLMKCFPNSN